MHKLFAMEYYRIDEARRALLPLFFFAALILAQIFRDIGLLQDQTIIAVDITLRIVASAVLVSLFFAVDGRWGTYTYPLLFLIFLAVQTAVGVINFGFRPSNRLFEFLPALLGICYFYFLLPGPLWLKIFGAADFSVVCLFFALTQKQYTADDRFVISITFVFLTGIGVLSAVTMEGLRKKTFLFQKKREHEINFKKAIGDLAFDAVVLVKNERIVDCNQNFEDIFDLDSAAVVGSDLSKYLRLDIDLNSRSGTQRGTEVKISGTILGESGAVPVEGVQKLVVINQETYLCLTFRNLSRVTLPNLQFDSREFLQRFAHLPLTKREREIALGILKGKTRYQIGTELFISDQTVKKHTANIYQKLGIGSKIDLFNMVHRN